MRTLPSTEHEYKLVVHNCNKNHVASGFLRRNAVDTDSEDDGDLSTATESWMVKFDHYIKTVEAIPNDVDIVDWWGGSSHLFHYSFFHSLNTFIVEFKPISNIGITCL